MIDSSSLDRLTGATVFDVDGDKIGKIGQVYVDPDTQAPTWASVTTGLFGTSESFVPLDDATVEGDDVRVAYQKAFVKDAPRVESDGALNDTETDTLYAYYSRGGAATTGTETDYATTGTTGTTGVGATDGYDTSGVNTDDAITRSEEQLHVGTEQREAGRARLHKYVTTEQQTVTVPVTHEEVHVVREPITDTHAGNATIGEEEHEVTLHAEQAVVEKDVVPVERIKLGTETVTEDQQVTEDVRKEQVEFEDDTHTTGSVDPETTR